MSKPRAAAIYARISKTTDESDTTSVEDQERLCREWAESRGWTVTRVYRDSGKSAFSRATTRPEYKAMLAAIKSGEHDGVIVRHIDRLTRQLRELIPFIDLVEDSGCRVATLEGDFDLSTPGSRSLVKILAVMAEQEAERKGERHRLANKARADQGHAYARRKTYGWVDRAFLEVDPVAQAHIRQAMEDVIAGKSVATIAREWNAAGVRTSYGKEWSQATVHLAIKREQNIGKLSFKGAPIKNPKIVPLVDPELYYAALAAMTARKTGTRKGKAPTKHVLSGVLRCHCGGYMYAYKWRDREIYRCNNSNKGLCYASINKKQIEPPVISYVIAELGKLNPADIVGAAVWKQQQQVTAETMEMEAEYEIALETPGLSIKDKAVLMADRTQRRTELADKLANLAPESVKARMLQELVKPDFLNIADMGKHHAAIKERFNALALEQRREIIAQFGTYTVHREIVSEYGRVLIVHPDRGPQGTEPL